MNTISLFGILYEGLLKIPPKLSAKVKKDAASIVAIKYYAIAKKYIFIIIFFIIGYLTHFFSKNMTVIMCIAIVFTNILSFGT